MTGSRNVRANQLDNKINFHNKKKSKYFVDLKNSTTFAPVKRNTMRKFRASEWESLLSRNERSRKCQVSQKRGNSSVGRAQPCRKKIRFTTLARERDTKEKIRRKTRTFRASEWENLLSHNERSRKCQVS